MKKSEKLSLKKNRISDFKISKIKGGTTIKTKSESDVCNADPSQNGEIC